MNRNISLTITLSQSEFVYLITQSPAVVVFGTVQLTSAIPQVVENYGQKKLYWTVELQTDYLETLITLLKELIDLPKSQGK